MPEFYAPPEWWHILKPLARQMRHEPTPTEKMVWNIVRNRQIKGAKFRRQHAIDRFIVDFVCLEKMLIIEIDGEIHDYKKDEDQIRQSFLESLGFRVLRFSNHEIEHQLQKVINSINEAL